MGSPILVPRPPPRLTSFVIPIYNEQEVLPELRRQMEALMSRIPGDVEILFVNDGSRDASIVFLTAWAGQDQRIKVLSFSRNFGHQAAITAGLDFSEGDVTIIMDADLQDPPQLALTMIEAYQRGYDVAYAQRVHRTKETWFKRATAWAYYRMMRRFVDPRLPADTGDFRLMGRAVVDALRTMREGHRFLRGMVAWLGFHQIAIPFERPARFAGTTKFSFSRMVRFAIDGVLSFSIVPLRTGIFLGLVLFMGSFGYMAVSVVRKMMGHELAWGWTSLLTLQCLVGGAILMSIGIVGEYVGRIFEEIKQRPIYVVSEARNLSVAARLDGRPSRSALGAVSMHETLQQPLEKRAAR